MILRAAGTLTLLWSLGTAADGLSAALRLPLPGFVLGFCMVYAMLACGLVRLESVEPACSFLSRNLAFFLIPVGAGLIDDAPLLQRSGLQIVAALALSGTIGLLVTGRLAQGLMAGRRLNGKSSGGCRIHPYQGNQAN